MGIARASCRLLLEVPGIILFSEFQTVLCIICTFLSGRRYDGVDRTTYGVFTQNRSSFIITLLRKCPGNQLRARTQPPQVLGHRHRYLAHMLTLR